MERTVRCWSLALVLAVGPTAAGEPATVSFVAADSVARSLELISEPESYDRESSDELSSLEAMPECDYARKNGVDVKLAWEVKRQQVEAHRIDISVYRGGFEKGRYLTSGKLSPLERQLLFEAAEPGIYYYWRVLTKTPEGWMVSGNGRFEAPVCPADDRPE